MCVNQDGVPFMNPLVATPNNRCRMNPGILDAVVQCIYRRREYGVIPSLCILEGGNSLQEKERIRHASQNAERSSRHYASLQHDDRPPHKQLSKTNRLNYDLLISVAY